AHARAEQAERLTGLGAAEVIDYREERFEERVADLDAVIDCHGSYAERSLPVLRPGGVLVSVPRGASPGVQEGAKRLSRRATRVVAEPAPVGLAGLTALMEGGPLQAHVAGVFDLEGAAEAHRLAEDGHHGGGKIVLRVT